jgi:hypothetical protein
MPVTCYGKVRCQNWEGLMSKHYILILLQLALASIVESPRTNPELCNFVIYDDSNNTNISYGSNYLSSILSRRQQQQSSFADFQSPSEFAQQQEEEEQLTDVAPPAIVVFINSCYRTFDLSYCLFFPRYIWKNND